MKTRCSHLLVVVSLSFIVGCGKPQVTRQISVGVDISGSVDKMLSKYRGYSNSVTLANRRNGWVKLYSFAQKPIRFYAGRFRDDMWGASKDVLNTGHEAQPGTHFARIMDQFGADASEAVDPDGSGEGKCLATYGALFTDGLIDDPAEVKEAAQRLADNPNFKCLFIGPADTKAVLENERLLAPLKEQNKLIVADAHDFQVELDRFLARTRGGK